MQPQEQQYQAPMPPQSAQKNYKQPMHQNQPNQYHVAPAPLIYPGKKRISLIAIIIAEPIQQNQQEISFNVQVRPQVPASSAVISTAAIISERKTWTHSHYPTIVYCTQCQQNVNTIVVYTLGAGSWIMVLLFFLFFFPVMCLPCCLTSMQDAAHYCPRCGHVCGRKNFLF